MEQMKKELEKMLEKIYANEKALNYVYDFMKIFVDRYL